jgi:cobyrinic acid a,c-diamide synthase
MHPSERADTTILPPRVVIAATHSGAGKTTVATGLLAAFRRAGVRVGAAKVGPDYIDPGYHQLACGRPSRNLDMWICGAEGVLSVVARAAAGADLLVIEGVMGLFDGAADGTASSTAAVAKLLDAPVILVVDAAATGQSVAAVVHGFASFDPEIRLAGVIVNRVGSDHHEQLLRHALASSGLPVVGVLRRDDRFSWRDRHLGLVPVIEEPDTVRRSIDALAAAVRDQVDLTAVQALAATAPPRRIERSGEPLPPIPTPGPPARIGIASGPAFSFTYPDNLEILRQAGAELVPFDPLTDRALPSQLDGLIAGGGFPEVYAHQLAANTPLLSDLAQRVRQGLAVWAECGGLLWLARTLDGHRMAGVVQAEATMTNRLTLGYRHAVTRTDTPLGPAGTTIRGHEFHYTTLRPSGDALVLKSRHSWDPAGFATQRLLASYLHVHLAGQEHLAQRFVTSCQKTHSPVRP